MPSSANLQTVELTHSLPGRTLRKEGLAFFFARSAGVTVRAGALGSGAVTTAEIDAKIAGLAGWRGVVLGRVRALILGADGRVVEAVKWRKPTNPAGVPVWSCGGILCTGEVYRDKVKLTFARGAALADPAGLFNSSLDGNVRRALDIFEGRMVDEGAFVALVRAAIALNLGGG